MVHIELPAESVHGNDLQEMKSLDFLGYDIEHEVVQKIAKGEMDPVTKEEFEVTESDQRVVDRICGKRFGKK